MSAYQKNASHGTPSLEVALEDPALARRIVLGLMGVQASVKAGLLGMSVGVGLRVMQLMFEEELDEKVGVKGKHNAGRKARRHGTDDGEVTLGGRKVRIRRPRARTLDGREVTLESYRQFQAEDPLDRMVLELMLRGVATRRYPGALEELGEQIEAKGVSKSAISRRFRKLTAQALEEVLSRRLEGLDLVALFIDGLVVAGHTVVASIGVDVSGRKHLLGLWEGATENAAVCKQLLEDLVERGLDTVEGLLVVIDGSKALRRAVKDVLGTQAVVQRCQVHKLRNVLEHLPKEKQAWVRRKLVAAWAEPDPEKAEAALHALVSTLEKAYPGAAASLREGLKETLTVNRLGLSAALRRTFRSTNLMESAISVVRATARRVKRWRNGEQVLRWTAAGLVEAEERFRRIAGYRELPFLRAALTAQPGAKTTLEAVSA